MQLACTMVGCQDTAGPDCVNVKRWYPNGKECGNGCTYCADPPKVQSYTKTVFFMQAGKQHQIVTKNSIIRLKIAS